MERPDGIRAAWDNALSAGLPALIELVTDPERRCRPHIQFANRRASSPTLVQGDPAALRFVRQPLRGKLAEFLNRRQAGLE